MLYCTMPVENSLVHSFIHLETSSQAYCVRALCWAWRALAWPSLPPGTRCTVGNHQLRAQTSSQTLMGPKKKRYLMLPECALTPGMEEACEDVLRNGERVVRFQVLSYVPLALGGPSVLIVFLQCCTLSLSELKSTNKTEMNKKGWKSHVQR